MKKKEPRENLRGADAWRAAKADLDKRNDETRARGAAERQAREERQAAERRAAERRADENLPKQPGRD